MLLPVLTFIGVATFERLVQPSIEDIAYARRIGRLRGFYLDLAPELGPYFVLVRSTRGRNISTTTGTPSGWQLTLTTAGMVAVLNSVVIGAFAGVLLQKVGVGPLPITLTTGAIVGTVAMLIQRRRHRLVLDAYSARTPSIGLRSSFPNGQVDLTIYGAGPGHPLRLAGQARPLRRGSHRSCRSLG
jgi:ribose/xylose/arabinose/galactoside ABC-type transport system permease subunit